MKAVLLLLIFQSFNVTYGQSGNCAQLESDTCSSCLKIPGCLWCADVDYSGARCNTLEEHEESRCNETVDGDPDEKPTLDTVALTEQNQISPRKVSSKIRVGVPLEFKVEVEPAENYPVDFYILMDLSASMDDDLNNLKKLALNISAKLSELTTRHRLAFGSFVDKVVAPYVKEEKVDKPYADGKDEPYDYKHVLDFTDKAEEFRAKVDEQVSSGNRDVPEGTFDALMQVAACEKELKWNPADKTRRMVLIATDATFHMAGEGRLGGIVHPNDAKCSLKTEGDVRLYANSLKLDYPTVNQVYQRLKKSDIQPIFAVGGGAHVYPVYEAIANQWADIGATWGKLDGDSKNIIQLIQESYDKITSTVRLNPSTTPDGVEVKIKRDCVSAAGVPENECQNVKPGVKVSFDVSVTATSCKSSNTEFKLAAAGFGTVDINLDIICSCDCENKTVPKSPKCNSNGTLACGSCQCEEGRSGRNCQCDATKFTNIDPSLCKMTNETGALVCEGNGECDCGVCKCNLIPGKLEKYYGKYCQCSNFNCDESDNLLCGGQDKGECKCGKCLCKLGFKGSNCGDVDCSLYMADCLTGKEGEPQVNCSNRGECNCGKCQCDTFYEGDHCEKCPSCAGKCGDYQQCVLCKVFGDTPANATLCDNCPEIEKVASLAELQALEYPTTCQETDDEGCTYYYTYLNRDNVTKVYAVENKDCPEGPDVLVIVLAVIGGIVGIGIILLILWKLLTAMVDRREYQKFEQDRAKSKWHREKNPLYKPATSTVQNPTFVGSKS